MEYLRSLNSTLFSRPVCLLVLLTGTIIAPSIYATQYAYVPAGLYGTNKSSMTNSAFMESSSGVVVAYCYATNGPRPNVEVSCSDSSIKIGNGENSTHKKGGDSYKSLNFNVSNLKGDYSITVTVKCPSDANGTFTVDSSSCSRS